MAGRQAGVSTRGALPIDATLADIEARAVEFEQKAAALRSVAARLREVYAVETSAVMTKTASRQARLSVPAASDSNDAAERILAHLAKQSAPIKFAHVRKALKMPTARASNAMRALVESGRAVRHGHRVGTPAMMQAAAPNTEGD